VSEESTLRAEELWRSFQIGSQRIEVLRGISITVPAGQRLFLCGASGAGKTTLLYTLAGLEHPEKGRVFLGPHDLYATGDSKLARLRNSRMGYVFQSYFLLPELTALENVTLPSMIRGRAARDRAAAWLEKTGLGDRLGHLPYELSGGEQQRVAIARALINDPHLIFADEPTGNLDNATGSEIMNLLLSLVAESGKSLIVVTHDTRLAALGDRRVTLADGQIASDVLTALTAP
jgi:predicted ABC-type transport system involved in lysophospholipase L1 biosynthesis ATPase subunit